MGNQRLKDYLRVILDLDRVATTNIVILKLLQSCQIRKEYDVLKARLDVLPLYDLNEKVWPIAYEAGYTLRRKGITVPTVDILICSIAKVHALSIFHHDEHIKTVSWEMGIKTVAFLKA